MSCIKGKGGGKDIYCSAQMPRYLLIYYEISFALGLFYVPYSNIICNAPHQIRNSKFLPLIKKLPGAKNRGMAENLFTLFGHDSAPDENNSNSPKSLTKDGVGPP